MKPMITGETEYLTIKESAALLRVSVPTVWRWVDSGRLPAYRVGGRSIRIRRADLASVLRPARGKQMNEHLLEQYGLRLGGEAITPQEIVEQLRRGQERIIDRRDGQLLPPSAAVIREAREERAAHL